jgi:hypothetical protein
VLAASGTAGSILTQCHLVSQGIEPVSISLSFAKQRAFRAPRATGGSAAKLRPGNMHPKVACAGNSFGSMDEQTSPKNPLPVSAGFKVTVV